MQGCARAGSGTEEIKGLGLDREKINVNGRGIGLGHPVGCTGIRIVVSLLYEMRRRNTRYGFAECPAGRVFTPEDFSDEQKQFAETIQTAIG